MTAENEALAMLGRLYEAKAGLTERLGAIFEEVQRVGTVAPDVPVMMETICAKIDELDVLITEARQLLDLDPRPLLN